MGIFYPLFFILFFSFPFQTQSQVLLEPGVDISQIGWLSGFSNRENIEKYINSRKEDFNSFGIIPYNITGLNLDKKDLVEIQKEFYKQKQDLDIDEIKKIEEAIGVHWESVKDIENEIRASAGFIPIESEKWGVEIVEVPSVNPYSDEYKGVWRLYKNEYKTIFDLIEKTDKDFYMALREDDEVYVEFISPYMNDYIEKSLIMSDTYTSVLKEAFKKPETFLGGYTSGLNWMSLRSHEIYKCFQNNFPNPVGENQQALMKAITVWYADQSLKGAKALMGEYDLLNENPSLTSGLPNSIVSNLLDYAHEDTPQEAREELEEFFRRALVDDRLEEGSFAQKSIYLNSLIGLKYLDALTSEEEEAFRRAEELGGIKFSLENPDVYWNSPTTDLK